MTTLRILVLLVHLVVIHAWLSNSRCGPRLCRPLFQTKTDDLLDELRAMSVKNLKAELTERSVSTEDVFEKEQLVQRLLEARQSPSKPKVEGKTKDKNSMLEVPIKWVSLAGQTMKGEDWSLQPNEQGYPTVELETPKRPLTFLVDTACSALLLRRPVAEELQLPVHEVPVQVLGAGGMASTSGTTQLPFQLGGESFTSPCVLQDVPELFDGVLGLQFFGQFPTVRWDFETNVIRFSRKPLDSGTPKTTGTLSLDHGVCTLPVWLGDRGPVTLLVDTGSNFSLLNWKGIQDLGLDRNSPALSRSTQGAVGADQTALDLTHVLHVSSRIRFSKSDAGLDLTQRLPFDIGNIAPLSPDMGGILGINALLCARAVEFTPGQIRLF